MIEHERPIAPEPKTFRSRTGEVPNCSDKWATGRYKGPTEKKLGYGGDMFRMPEVTGWPVIEPSKDFSCIYPLEDNESFGGENAQRFLTIIGENLIEKGAKQQMRDVLDLPITWRGALMPDAHTRLWNANRWGSRHKALDTVCGWSRHRLPCARYYYANALCYWGKVLS